MIFVPPKSTDSQGLFQSLKNLVDSLNRFHPPVWDYPVFADDKTAAAANLRVGYPYVTPDGFVKRRMG